MMKRSLSQLAASGRALALLVLTLQANALVAEQPDPKLVHWTAYPTKPILAPGKPGEWDENIRERFWMLREADGFHGWYAGWQGKYDKSRPNLVHLGYATSKDGIHWEKHAQNPIFAGRWVEDMCVVKDADSYYMFAEDESLGKTAIHLLTSQDKLHWTPLGNVLEELPGSSWEAGWVGSPLAWKEKSQWYLLYEGGPPGKIALALSSDGKHWTRSPDNPVLKERFGWEDSKTVPDSIIKREGLYHLFYHALGTSWQTGVAVSRDLRHWTRWQGNPITSESSATIMETPTQYLLYVNDSQAQPLGVRLYTSQK